MSIRPAAALLATGALAFTLACAAAQRQDPRESLPESLRDFHNQLIWGRYAEAAGYLPEDQRAYFIGTYDDLDGELRFVEYELGSVDLDAVNNEAVVMVTLSWYRVPYYVVERVRIREVWALDDENDHWWLVRREEAGARNPRGSAARPDAEF
jgi:hypothetical protein